MRFDIAITSISRMAIRCRPPDMSLLFPAVIEAGPRDERRRIRGLPVAHVDGFGRDEQVDRSGEFLPSAGERKGVPAAIF